MYALTEDTQSFDQAFISLKQDMLSDKDSVWTSVALKELYSSYGGSSLSRQQLAAEVVKSFGDDVVIFSSPGLANIVLFRTTASTLLREVETDDSDRAIEDIAKRVSDQCKVMNRNKYTYYTGIDKDLAIEYSSETMMSLLAKVSDKLDHTLPALMIGNIITSIVTNKPTTLQVSLELLAREKTKIRLIV